MAKVSNSSTSDGNPWTTSTNSSSYAIHIWKEPVWFTIFRITLMSTIALVGALGNLAVSYVVTKRPEMWTAVNFYIRNLSLTDLCVLLINYPLAVMRERYFNVWPLGEFVCRAILPGVDGIFCVAIWTITCIAVERYRALSRDSTYYHASLKTARITILTLWIASLVLTCLPLYMTVEYHQIADGNFKCSFVWPDINMHEYAVFSQYAEKSKCEIIRDQSSSHGLIGAYIPQCSTDGSFEKVQCWSSTGYCWCVNEEGHEVTGSKIRGTPDCSNEKIKSKCEMIRDHSNAQGLIGAYIPQCAADGSFKMMQCWGSTGYCWCVDRKGREVTGTKIRGTPDCNVQSTRSKCEQMRLEAVERRPMVGKYVPQCRKDGSFDPVQCWPSTGYCWCVDKQGQRLVGTEVQFKRPVC